jgi:S-(hydroxymethyl)glutathione dehydrogenase / alcohol dehydrogenase
LRVRAALHLAAGKPLEVTKIDMEEPGVDDVVVRMSAVGICGTDLHQVRGEWRRPTPMVLGHEGAGVIEQVGKNVDPARIGEEVVLTWAASCGGCADCARGRPAACLRLHRAMAEGTLVDGTTGLSLDGQTVYRGTATGALADRLVVRQHLAVATGGGIPLHHAALLGCAALTGAGALLFVARPRPESVILVIGLGGVGQFCVQAARLLEASLIIGVDPVASRRQQAIHLGAAHAVDPAELEDLVATVAPEGADVALDVVGTAATTRTAVRFTRSGGTAVIVGLPPAGEDLSLDFSEFNRREKWLTGTMYGSEDPVKALPMLLEYVRHGQLDLASMVGPVYPLDQVNEAVQASMAGSANRVLVAP